VIQEDDESDNVDSVMVTVGDGHSGEHDSLPNVSTENQQVSQGQEVSDDNPSVELDSPSQVSNDDISDDDTGITSFYSLN
jgi:hypothetical protein